jgi:hypothetical protein
MVASIFNIYIPKLPIDHKLPKKNPVFMLNDFWYSFKALWIDTRGQVSLAVTTLFWGAGATLRLVVIAWAASSLNFSFKQASYLMAILAVGIAAGSVVAARYIKLEESTKVLPAGIVMGLLVVAMAFVQHWQLAVVLLFVIGALAGFFVVPLNALLQHRGHELIGAGHSIAVQNFNEHIGILLMLGAYLLMVKAQIPINIIVIAFGVFVSLCMMMINKRYKYLN